MELTMSFSDHPFSQCKESVLNPGRILIGSGVEEIHEKKCLGLHEVTESLNTAGEIETRILGYLSSLSVSQSYQ